MTMNRRTLIAAGAGLSLISSSASGKTKATATSAPRQGENGTGLTPDAGSDQTEAIQRLIDEAVHRKVALSLPPGEFLVRTLELRPGLKLAGTAGLTILKHAGSGAMLVGNAVNDMRLANIVLDGALERLDPARAKGLLTLSNSASVNLQDLTVRDSLLNGISLERCGGQIRNCSFSAIADAAIFSLDGEGVEIADNTISNAGNNGILVWRSKVGEDGTKVTGNRISLIAATAGGAGQNGNAVNVYRAGNVMVSGNRIADCAFTAVRGNAASNLQIIGNNCSRLGEVALYAEFGFQGTLIASNIVDNAATGISVTNFNEGGRLAVIQGNLIRNLFRREAEPIDKRGDGIAVEADAVITGNTIENAQTFGLLIGWGRHMREVSATSNLIRNSQIGIGVTGDIDAGAVMITSNMISGSKKGAIRSLKMAEPYGPDLVLSKTETARVLIERNMAV